MISVFTPTFNIGSILERPFQSLVNQTYTNWEWVIYDDSTDPSTWEYIQKLADKEPRISAFKANTHSGFVGYTKLQACNNARGDILVELDHDDKLTPVCLERIVKFFKQYPKAGFAYSRCTGLAERTLNSISYGPGYALGFGAEYYYYHFGNWILGRIQPPINPISVTHIVGVPNHVRAWRKETYYKAGGHNPVLRVADDYDLLIRTANITPFIQIPEVLYFQYIREYPTLNAHSAHNKEIQSKVAEFSTKYGTSKLFKREGYYKKFHSANPYYENWEVAPSETIRPVNYNTISIIMPTYDREILLTKAIESVLAQSYDNWELIIIGDNCPILEEFMKIYKNPKIKWWNLFKQYNDGGTTPRNYALKAIASGEYIAYLDDDNYWEYNHLETLINSINTQGSDYAFSSMIMDSVTIYCTEPKLYRIDSSILLHKRELLDKYGYWKTREEVGYSHDWELVSRWKDHPWSATLLPTLNYNAEAGNNDVITIKEAYDDQDI